MLITKDLLETLSEGVYEITTRRDAHDGYLFVGKHVYIKRGNKFYYNGMSDSFKYDSTKINESIKLMRSLGNELTPHELYDFIYLTNYDNNKKVYDVIAVSLQLYDKRGKPCDNCIDFAINNMYLEV